MQQFIPFEDDWDALENLRPEDLIPYRVGLLDKPGPNEPGHTAQRTVPMSPSIFNSSPACTPMRRAVPAGNSST
jgi:hypothetical protein